MTVDDINNIHAERIGGEPGDEAGHFIVCGHCGQAIDLRRLGDVLHHEEEMHEPIVRPS